MSGWVQVRKTHNLVAVADALHHGVAAVLATAYERHHVHGRRRADVLVVSSESSFVWCTRSMTVGEGWRRCAPHHNGVVDVINLTRDRAAKWTETMLLCSEKMAAVRAVLLSDIQSVLSLARHQYGYLISKTTSLETEDV